jgi:hypothetical protein
MDSPNVSGGGIGRVKIPSPANRKKEVGAQFGNGFNIPKQEWKYCEKVKGRGYPFAPAVRLWKAGLVPIKYDGVWRLFGRKNGKVQELYRLEKKGEAVLRKCKKGKGLK